MSNTTITNAIGRVKGKINPNTKLSPVFKGTKFI